MSEQALLALGLAVRSRSREGRGNALLVDVAPSQQTATSGSAAGSMSSPSASRSPGRSGARVIDLHAHLSPGLDHGARDLADSIAIARAMAADGVRVVAATPHVRAEYPTTPAAMEAGLATVRAALDQARIGLRAVAGGETGPRLAPHARTTGPGLSRWRRAQLGDAPEAPRSS